MSGRGLRGYGVKVWLKPKAEPDANGDAGAYGDEVDEDFEDRNYEDGGNAHGVRFVEGGRGQVEVDSSGAPGGGVAAVGGDNEARFSLAEVGATCLNRRRIISKEQSACLGGEAGGSRISVPSFGVDPAWGDKVVSATENIAFGGNG